MALYSPDGSIRITITDGTQLTGTQAPDGSYYAVINDGTEYTGLRHPSGAFNIVLLESPSLSLQAPNGSLYAVESDAEYFLYRGGDLPEVIAPFSPADLSPALWIEPAQGGLFQNNAGTTEASANGNVVGYAPDLSGNSKNYISVANDSTRPTLQGVGSYPCIRFDGTDDVLHRTESLGLYEGVTYTLAIALKSSSTTQLDKRVFAGGNTASGNTLFIPIQTNATTGTTASTMYRDDLGVLKNTNITSTNVFDTNNHVYIITDDGANITAYKDGAVASTATHTRSTLTINRSSIGALMRSTTLAWWGGDIYGIVAIKRVLNSEELSDLNTYMSSLYGPSTAILSSTYLSQGIY